MENAFNLLPVRIWGVQRFWGLSREKNVTHVAILHNELFWWGRRVGAPAACETF